MSWEEKREGKLVVVSFVVGHGLREKFPLVQLTDTFGAFGAVFGNGLLGGDGGIQVHLELRKLDFS